MSRERSSPAWRASGRRARAAAAALVLGLAGAGARAHDSWLAFAGQPAPGLLAFSLTTSDRFPQPQSPIPAEALAQATCRDGAGRALDLRPRAVDGAGLSLRVRLEGAPGPLACWAETRALEVQLEPAAVAAYLDEVQAPDAVRAAWKARHAAGAPWRESYRKSIRTELNPAPGRNAAGSLAALRQPAGLGLEIVVLGDAPVAAGAPLRLRVLENGQPLAAQPVQLLGERSPLGLWLRTDAAGEIATRLPLAGRWLLRTGRIAVPSGADAPWTSRLATLLLEAV